MSLDPLKIAQAYLSNESGINIDEMYLKPWAEPLTSQVGPGTSVVGQFPWSYTGVIKHMLPDSKSPRYIIGVGDRLLTSNAEDVYLR